jgi:hypothetical protein
MDLRVIEITLGVYYSYIVSISRLILIVLANIVKLIVLEVLTKSKVY